MILHHSGEPLTFGEIGVSSRRPTVAGGGSGDHLQLDAVVARHIRHVLGLSGGKIHGPGGAGELLGMNPNTLRARMRKLGIPFRSHASRDQ